MRSRLRPVGCRSAIVFRNENHRPSENPGCVEMDQLQGPILSTALKNSAQSLASHSPSTGILNTASSFAIDSSLHRTAQQRLLMMHVVHDQHVSPPPKVVIAGEAVRPCPVRAFHFPLSAPQGLDLVSLLREQPRDRSRLEESVLERQPAHILGAGKARIWPRAVQESPILVIHDPPADNRRGSVP
jgi:hypothetical protein